MVAALLWVIPVSERAGEEMQLTHKDQAATVLTAFAVLVFAVAHQEWNVWLIGGSHRWATGAIAVLGFGACSLGSPGKDAATKLIGVLGVAAGALVVYALVSGSLTALSLLTLDVVVLWAASLLRHSAHNPVHA
jgi:hypothetical protein